MNNDLILAAVGPTASGKTSLSIELAQEFDGEIICCDSMQIYKHMKIGTASPTDEELKRVPHHLFNFVEPNVNYNAAMYQNKVRRMIEDVLSRGRTPILCGGTGLYLKAALYDMNFTSAATDEKYRAHLEDLYDEKGADYLHEMLMDKDPESADNIHKNNVKRVIRALEIIHISGVKKSAQKQEEKKHYSNSYIIGLMHDRNALYDRINRRVDIMVNEGLESEVKNLIDMNIPKNSTSMQAIGYKEWLDFFADKITLDKCIYDIKINSRHYAKRQLTWFNKMDLNWFDYNESILLKYQNIIKFIKN